MNSQLMKTQAAVALAALTLSAPFGLAQQQAQRMFPSAEAAGQSLFQAVQRNDVAAIQNILGGPPDLASSGDEAQDKADLELFAQKYHQMHRFHREPDGQITLYVGAENWPFPIPLVAKNGSWRFDPGAGSKEVLFRRIGENELAAIAACREFAAARKSDAPPAPLDGYNFRVLSGSGFALIAYPAEYRSSGVMTFAVTRNGAVYQKDLGPNTAATVTALTTLHKDGSWRLTGD